MDLRFFLCSDYGGRGGAGGLVHSAGGGAGGGSNEDVEKPSFLQMALLDEEKIGGCTSTSLVKDSKATIHILRQHIFGLFRTNF